MPLLLRIRTDTKKSSEHFIDREDYRYHGSIKIHWNWNHNSSPFGGPVVHRHKNPPNWAELAVWPRWHLQKGLRYNFNSNEFWYSHGTFSLLCQWNARNFFFVSVRLRNNSEEESKYVHISTIFGTWSTTTKFDIRSIIIIGCQNVRAIEQLRSFL